MPRLCCERCWSRDNLDMTSQASMVVFTKLNKDPFDLFILIDLFTWSICVPFGIQTSFWLEYWDPWTLSHWCATAGGDNSTQVHSISFPLLSRGTADRKWRNNKREGNQINACCHLITYYFIVYLFLIIAYHLPLYLYRQWYYILCKKTKGVKFTQNDEKKKEGRQLWAQDTGLASCCLFLLTSTNKEQAWTG